MFAVASLKSYGDLVIARWALRLLEGAAWCPPLVLGAHLNALDDALPGQHTRFVIEHGESNVPAAYDFKARGAGAALRSLLRLRQCIARLPLSANTALLFDRIGIREALISGNLKTLRLPAASNIYLAYQNLFRGANAAVLTHSAMNDRPVRVAIFPGSRLLRKNIPPAVIGEIVGLCDRLRLDWRIYIVEGERRDVAHLSNAVVLPRRFPDVIEAITRSDSVISADSLPAHMAEYFAIPAFVLSPIPNSYWLPLSSFQAGRWSTFTERSFDEGRLRDFFACNQYVR